MARIFILLICLFAGIRGNSQTLRPGVLVVGNSPAAFAAAIQSANSGVKTVLIDAGKMDLVTFSNADRSSNSGIYAKFMIHADSLQKSKVPDYARLTPAFNAKVFKAWTDTVKNLTVLPESPIKKLEKSRKGWEVDVPGREIKPDVLLDATADQSVAKLAGMKQSNIVSLSSSVYADKRYRTSVATYSDVSRKNVFVPVSSFVVPDLEYLVLAAASGTQPNLATGQGAGTVAAYCAFFKTSTKNLIIRTVQSELLTYNARLLKFEDIPEADSSMVALQHIGVTGILKAREDQGKLFFDPERTVSTEELRAPLRELYSRSQIWFLDNRAEKLTLEQALSLIKFCGSRGDELNREVQKAWNTSLKFKGSYDLKKLVTRKEMAVLLDKYLQPFVVAVDLEGNSKV